MKDPIDFRLKPEDSPPPDPQAVAIVLLGELQAHTDELLALRALLTRWSTDPTGCCRRALPRVVDLAEHAGRLLDLGESWARADRSAGTFSAVYGALERGE